MNVNSPALEIGDEITRIIVNVSLKLTSEKEIHGISLHVYFEEFVGEGGGSLRSKNR